MIKSRLAKQYLLGVSALLLSLILGLWMILYLSMRPKFEGENVASQVAQKYVNFETILDIHLYNGKQSYYTVLGKNESGGETAVAIGQSEGDVYVFDLADGLTIADAQAKASENGADQPSKTVFGIFDGRPIWEVTADNGFYVIDFQTGDLLKKESL